MIHTEDPMAMATSGANLISVLCCQSMPGSLFPIFHLLLTFALVAYCGSSGSANTMAFWAAYASDLSPLCVLSARV